LRLLEQICDATLMDAVWEPRRCGEEAGEIGFLSTFQHATGDVGETCVVQDAQTSQGMLAMLKLAPMLKELAKDRRMGGHDGSWGYNGKLQETFALSPKGWDRA
jgi:hypothetical protein